MATTLDVPATPGTFPPSEQVIGLYAQRFLIKESFRDFQRGVLDFMRMLPRLEEQHRREQWLILGTSAHWVSMKLGEAVEDARAAQGACSSAVAQAKG